MTAHAVASRGISLLCFRSATFLLTFVALQVLNKHKLIRAGEEKTMRAAEKAVFFSDDLPKRLAR